MVNPAGRLDQSESRKVWPEAAGALMTGNVLLSGRDGPTLTASPTLPPRPDRTLEQDTHRWKTLGETLVEEEISWKEKSPQQLRPGKKKLWGTGGRTRDT